MRLNRYISQSGHCSRRHADELISAGRVKLNGVVVTELGVQIDPERDKVSAEGHPIHAPARQVVLLLNKPRGVLCTVSDPHGRRTVMDLVQLDQKVVPVGRLDADSSGALLLTNDGELMNRLLHPSGHVPKEYIVLTDRELSAEEEERLRGGVRLEGRRTKPCELERIGREGSRPRYRMVLTEGRNRQIRRMMAGLDVKVERLHRRGIAGLSVEDLEPGEWRVLLRKEIDQLHRLAGLMAEGAEAAWPVPKPPAGAGRRAPRRVSEPKGRRRV
jgi:23S rRNA pseudouridine2605 synthase